MPRHVTVRLHPQKTSKKPKLQDACKRKEKRELAKSLVLRSRAHRSLRLLPLQAPPSGQRLLVLNLRAIGRRVGGRTGLRCEPRSLSSCFRADVNVLLAAVVRFGGGGVCAGRSTGFFPSSLAGSCGLSLPAYVVFLGGVFTVGALVRGVCGLALARVCCGASRTVLDV